MDMIQSTQIYIGFQLS